MSPQVNQENGALGAKRTSLIFDYLKTKTDILFSAAAGCDNSANVCVFVTPRLWSQVGGLLGGTAPCHSSVDSQSVSQLLVLSCQEHTSPKPPHPQPVQWHQTKSYNQPPLFSTIKVNERIFA